MARKWISPDTPRRSREPRPHRARVTLKAGSVKARAEVEITTGGLLAVGTLVSAILLSVVPIVVAATRKLPPAD